MPDKRVGAGVSRIRQSSECQDAALHRTECRIARQAGGTWCSWPCPTAWRPNSPCRCCKRAASVIDLSADFRLNSAAVYKEFYAHDHPAPDLLRKSVYGLPEIYREQIKNASLVASPGCYPTSILLPLIPLLRARLIKPTGIIADSLSGVSGAGRKAELDYLFVECNESVRPYGVPKHRHLSEIEQELSLAAGEAVTIQFTPHLIPVNRGILTTLYRRARKAFQHAAEAWPHLAEKIAACYAAAYGNEPFVRLLEGKALPDTKNVVGTNVIEIAWRLDHRHGPADRHERRR